MTVARNYEYFTMNNKQYELYCAYNLTNDIYVSYIENGRRCIYERVKYRQDLIDGLNNVEPKFCGIKIDEKYKQTIMNAIDKTNFNRFINDQLIKAAR
jgi:hypothetical protein